MWTFYQFFCVYILRSGISGWCNTLVFFEQLVNGFSKYRHHFIFPSALCGCCNLSISFSAVATVLFYFILVGISLCFWLFEFKYLFCCCWVSFHVITGHVCIFVEMLTQMLCPFFVVGLSFYCSIFKSLLYIMNSSPL